MRAAASLALALLLASADGMNLVLCGRRRQAAPLPRMSSVDMKGNREPKDISAQVHLDVDLVEMAGKAVADEAGQTPPEDKGEEHAAQISSPVSTDDALTNYLAGTWRGIHTKAVADRASALAQRDAAIDEIAKAEAAFNAAIADIETAREEARATAENAMSLALRVAEETAMEGKTTARAAREEAVLSWVQKREDASAAVATAEAEVEAILAQVEREEAAAMSTASEERESAAKAAAEALAERERLAKALELLEKEMAKVAEEQQQMAEALMQAEERAAKAKAAAIAAIGNL